MPVRAGSWHEITGGFAPGIGEVIVRLEGRNVLLMGDGGEEWGG